MRLIDADKMTADLLTVDPQYETMIQWCLTVLDAQPIIEERKRGKWIVYKAPDKQHCGLIKCPFCGEDMIAEADEYNFCPNCGAQMER